ncbi:MAG: hypothetical protein SO044_03705 [Agathobaculum sp.]|nr:hypothetical protein [Agathobaculum sp.]MDY3711504.1 hypothetical protein [Agathobaculum sp.]
MKFRGMIAACAAGLLLLPAGCAAIRKKWRCRIRTRARLTPLI